MLQLKQIKDKQIRQGYFYYMVGYLVNYIIYQEFFRGNTNFTMDFFFFKLIYIIHDLHMYYNDHNFRPFLSIIKYKYIETFFIFDWKGKLTVMKYPLPMVLKILSMELFEGRVQLKMLKCLFRREGMSLRPPPGWIMAAIIWMSTMLVNSPGFSRL